jgi:murein DD-endopeptidase
VLGYGEDVLAVSNATVAATRDDVSEGSLVSARRKHAIEDASGNYVALELRPGRYVLYEHLKPGSVRVKGGQRVRKGQVIASLGFTGDSTGPHLHLHVGDAASPLGAEGLPFVFDRFTMLGVFTDMADLGKRRWAGAAGSAARQLERPAPGAVIDFGER